MRLRASNKIIAGFLHFAFLSNFELKKTTKNRKKNSANVICLKTEIESQLVFVEVTYPAGVPFFNSKTIFYLTLEWLLFILTHTSNNACMSINTQIYFRLASCKCQFKIRVMFQLQEKTADKYIVLTAKD